MFFCSLVRLLVHIERHPRTGRPPPPPPSPEKTRAPLVVAESAGAAVALPHPATASAVALRQPATASAPTTGASRRRLTTLRRRRCRTPTTDIKITRRLYRGTTP